MSFLDHIRACNAHDPACFRPFLIDERPVGHVHRDAVTRLAAFTDVFGVHDDSVMLNPALATPAARTEAVREVLARLAEEGVVRPPRGEDYAVVTRFGDEPLMRLDRGHVALFGVRAFGLHVNGFVRGADGLKLWIGRRAPDKTVAPGKLDNMVAGGQPAGLTLAQNLRKEAEEEAAVPAALADRARPVGAVTYRLQTDEGLKPDTLFIYDLELPADFTPRPNDGEITDFRLMPVAEVMERVRTTDDFKFNVNLVLIDFFLRHGLLDPDSEPDYLELVQGLRAPL